jgi:TolA-binding protein
VKEKARRPEVEELSDLEWARVERGLWQRMEAGDGARGEHERDVGADRVAAREGGWRRKAAFGGVVALAAAAMLVVWLGRRGAEPASTEAPARVVTRASATTVSFADAAIEVAPDSALLMSGGVERGATIVLERGRAGFHVAPRRQSAAFTVVAGSAVVRVVGTRFEVAREGEAIEVVVREGEVDVRYLGQVHRVSAGSQWRSPESAAAAVQQEPLLDGGAGSSEGASDEPSARDEASASDEAAAVQAAKKAERARERARVAKREAAEEEAAEEAAAEKKAAEKKAAEAAAADAKAKSRELAQRAAGFAAAAKLESGSPAEAIRRYLELAKLDDQWGRNALYAAARLALDVGDKDRAAALARSYLSRFPDGSNAPDARALLKALP